MNVKACFLFAILLPLGFALAGCSKSMDKAVFDINDIKSYRDIPGVSFEEIGAIESLKSGRLSFSFGTLYSTEAFEFSSEINSGYLIKFGELLSDLFDIPFDHKFFPWDSLITSVENGEIDFIGDLTISPERKRHYLMSLPIAERPLEVFLRGDSAKIKTTTDLDGLKIGFCEDVSIAESIERAYPSLEFERINYENSMDVSAALRAGEIDAIIADTTYFYFFTTQGFSSSIGILPLVYTPISFTAKTPEFEPVISVLNKYIVAGGIDKLHTIYKESNFEFAKYYLYQQLTDDERSYLNGLISRDLRIPVALEPDNYPVCFYNNVEGAFQGIAPDILRELSDFTGLSFDIVTDKDSTWGEILGKLQRGEAALVSELIYSEGRNKDYIWSLPYASSHYVLLSKSSYPDLELYQIVRSTVGIGRDSVYEELFNLWFPDNPNVKYYEIQADVMDALESGKIDLMFTSERSLLYLTNYREKADYKVNISLNASIEESYFGFNKNEVVLCSIIKKAQALLDADRISKNWMNRTFDYSAKIANDKLKYFTVFAVCLSLLLVVLAVLLIVNVRIRKLHKKQVVTLSTIYKSLPDLVYCKDINGKYTSCNKSFEAYNKLYEADLIGKTPFEIYPDEYDRALNYFETDKKVMENRIITKLENWVNFPDNSRCLMETLKAPLIQGGKVIGMLNVARDITEHHKTEMAANEASRAKSDFLAKMSHEIRTPMNAITGMAELALRADNIYGAQKHILTVKQASAHLLSIINDILDFTKIEKGNLEIVANEYSFSSLINNVISIIRMRLIDSELRFVVNIDCNIPNSLIGDETRIRQVMLNVLSNAVKYTEKGFISFTVNRDIVDDDTVILSLEVLDSGKGIKKDDVKKLFGEYIQLDPGSKSIEGLGLGLAITANIVKQMNGSIDVDSEFGKGSSFTISIPQKIASLEPLAQVKNPREKRIILYERREICAHSIISAFENLDLAYTLVINDFELDIELSKQSFNYLFISNVLLERNKENIYKLKNMKIVILAEFGETVSNRNLSLLAMPIYSINIANVINGKVDNLGYFADNGQTVKFSAPDVNVLIIDDVNTNLKVAEGLLLPYRMHIDLCNNARDAIIAIKQKHYDLVFMDHKMPVMDGVVATKLIRSIRDDEDYFKNVPIIALTANAVLGTRQMFLENGFNDFLSKPIDIIELDAILDKWIPKGKKKRHALKKDDFITIEDGAAKFDNDLKIRGVDTKKGMHFSGGNLESYIETLEIFYADGIKKISEITNSLNNNKYRDYSIYLHALKSALANIGADDMSLEAKSLEVAGENNFIEYIDNNNQNFLIQLKILLDSIEKKIVMYKKKNKSETINIGLFKIELTKLKEALEILDAGAINATIDTLKRTSTMNSISESIDAIAAKILIGEYEDAADLVAKLYSEIKNEF